MCVYVCCTVCVGVFVQLSSQYLRGAVLLYGCKEEANPMKGGLPPSDAKACVEIVHLADNLIKMYLSFLNCTF